MTLDPTDTALNEARTIAGGPSKLARELGISSQAVSAWTRVPIPRVLDVERITGVSRHRLRPDIFGPEPPVATKAPLRSDEGGCDAAPPSESQAGAAE